MTLFSFSLGGPSDKAAGKDAASALRLGDSPFAENGLLARFPAPAFIVSIDGAVVQRNAYAHDLLDNLQKTGPDDFVELLEIAAQTSEPQITTLKFMADDALVYWELTILPVTGNMDDAKDEVSGETSSPDTSFTALVLCREVTLERNLRSALVDSRQRYKDLVEASSDFAWETGADGSFVFVSPRGAMGFRAEELVGHQPDEFIIGQGRGDVSLPFSARVPLDGAEVWFRCSDGYPACLVSSCVPLFDDSGNWLGARGVCRDVTDERERDAQLTSAHNREQLLTYIVRAIRDVIEPQKMLDAAATATMQGLNATGCRIYRSGERNTFWGAAESGILPEDADDLANSLGVERGFVTTGRSGIPGIAITTKYRHVINGAICLWRDEGDPPWSEDDRTLLSEIASQLGIAIEQIINHEERERISSTDALTGLINRRIFFETMGTRMTHASRTGRPGAFCYVDFDNFKLVNDVHGHNRGDEALRKLTSILDEHTRANDLVGRLGGDEFGLWLEETDEEGALANAHNLIKASHALHEFSGSPDHLLGLSIGIAIYHPDADETMEQLVSRADDAMYEAKKNGKGGFMMAPVPAPSKGTPPGEGPSEEEPPAESDQ